MGNRDELNDAHQLMIDPFSTGSGIQSGWTTEARTSLGWAKTPLEHYAGIHHSRNKLGTGILYTLQFKKVFETIQSASKKLNLVLFFKGTISY